KITEEGVDFVSHVDGGTRFLSPERAMEIQWALGADIAMAFDHVVPGQADHALAKEGMERTLRWLGRCRRKHEALVTGELGGERGIGTRELRIDGESGPAREMSIGRRTGSPDSPFPIPDSPSTPPNDRQTLWPIVQGGTHEDLRLASLEASLELGDWTGIAIGGLSVGEPKPVMHRILELLGPALPIDRPRYLMGVGFPDDLVEGIARGVDLFDCVAATRNGRHGSAWTSTGKLNVRNASNRSAAEPLDSACDCEVCGRFSRAYIRHLFMAEEMLGMRLVSLHNVHFLVKIGEVARRAILEGRFESWRRAWHARYQGNES
ncbi:MAG: tRNA guanosine(34) transglycosylase Tgt, partial [Gemmatimonadota bacterium]